MRRSLIAIGLVAALVASLGMTAMAQVPTASHSASIDVRNVLAGTAGKEFKITVKRTGGLPNEAVNQVMIFVPNAFTVTDAKGPTGWSALILRTPTATRVFFDGGSLPGGSQAVFSIFANAPTPPNDITSRWDAHVSTDAGETSFLAAPETANAMDTITRVLSVTSFAITAPAGATDNSVTGAQNNTKAACQVQNHGSGTLSVDAIVSGSNFSATDTAPQSLAPGASAVYNYDLSFNDVNSTTPTTMTCDADSPGKANSGPFNKSQAVTIQPRAVFDYVATSVSPKVVRPGAAPNFSVRVNKHQTGTATTDGSPAVTLEPSTILPDGTVTNPKSDFKFNDTKPTPLSGPLTVNAGKQDNVIASFAALEVPALRDGNYDITLNLAGTDANGAPVVFRPVPNVGDRIRVDALIPTVTDLILSGPMSRCCNAGPAVKNNDTLSVSGTIKDGDPATGATINCGACKIVKAELIQLSAETGGSEVGQRITVTCSNTAGALSCSYAGAYDPLTKAILFAIVVEDEAGNSSGEVRSPFPLPVDNVAPFLKSAATFAAPSAGAADQQVDFQRQLRVEFSEAVDNFNRPLDGFCPGVDWKVDENTVVTCARDTNFLGAGLLVTNQLPEDLTSRRILSYFPNLDDDPNDVRFHDRVDIPIQTGATVDVLDKIPPGAPIVTSVAGKAADSSDGRFYTTSSQPAFVVANPASTIPSNPVVNRPTAVKAGYTAQLWKESNNVAGLQTEATDQDGNGSFETLADEKIGQADAAGPTVTVTPTTATALTASSTEQLGHEYKVYARSLDNASPANPTPSNIVKSVLVVVDIAAPALRTATALADRIRVGFGGQDQFVAEAVIGTNSPNFWEVVKENEGPIGPTKVEGSGSERDVVMTGNPRYDPLTVASIRYLYFGTPSGRYRDRAGNEVPDSGALSI